MTALQVIDPHGEVVAAVTADRLLAAFGLADLTAAEVTDLAAFTEQAGELASIAKEARNDVGRELVRRLDYRGGPWTLREGDYEITSPSPEAGTTAYSTDLLRDALAGLVVDGVISAEGANGALERVEPTAPVPYALLRDVVEALDGQLDPPDEVRVRDVLADLLAGEPEPAYRQKPAGIARLRKIAAAREAIDACRVAVSPPERVAKVKRIAEDKRRAAA